MCATLPIWGGIVRGRPYKHMQNFAVFGGFSPFLFISPKESFVKWQIWSGGWPVFDMVGSHGVLQASVRAHILSLCTLCEYYMWMEYGSKLGPLGLVLGPPKISGSPKNGHFGRFPLEKWGKQPIIFQK